MGRAERARRDACQERVVSPTHATLAFELREHLAHQPDLERVLEGLLQTALLVEAQLFTSAAAKQIGGLYLAHAISSTSSRSLGSASALATNAALAVRKRLRTVSSGAPQMA